MYQYPYGNAQQLNLDWILSKIQELEVGASEVNIEEVANALISASFDAGVSYRRYDYCFYNGKLYRALNDTTGAFNPADWLEVVIGDDIPVLTRLLNAVDASLTSLQTTVNDLDSDDVDNASDVTGTSVSDALDTLDTAVTNLQNAVGGLDSDDVDNASNVTGTSVTDALNTLLSQYKLNKLYRFYIPNGTQINANESPAILTSWTYDNAVEIENGKIHINGNGFALVFVHVIGSCGNNRLWFRVQGVNTNTQHISYGAYCTGDVFAVTQYSVGVDDYIWLEFLEPLLVGGGSTGAILIYVMLL